MRWARVNPRRAIHGGAWFFRGVNIGVAYRDTNAPTSRYDSLGFRLARRTS